MKKTKLLSYYTSKELRELGLKKYGKNLRLSRKVSLYSPENIAFGDNVRIDDFCILSGKIKIASQVHIGAGVYLYGNSGISIGSYAGVSAKSIIYSEIDDFASSMLVGAQFPKGYREVIAKKVSIADYCQVGAGAVLFPGVEMQKGSMLGAVSLLKSKAKAWTVYAGIPATERGQRNSKKIIKTIAAYEREHAL